MTIVPAMASPVPRGQPDSSHEPSREPTMRAIVRTANLREAEEQGEEVVGREEQVVAEEGGGLRGEYSGYTEWEHGNSPV